jgi:hypothetical protein
LLPLLDYVDMDGSLLISNDPASGVQVTPTGAIYPEKVMGNGVVLLSTE